MDSMTHTDGIRLEKPRRAANVLLVALFLGVLVTPPARQLLRGGDYAAELRKAERRGAAPFPKQPASRTEIESWPRGFDAWYADALGFREPLLRVHNRLFWFGLGVSPNPTVKRGSDGWLFFSGHETLEQIRGAHPFTEDELAQWQRVFERRHAWLTERGIEYLFVLGPTKGRVYSERLPAAFRPRQPGRLEQFLAHMREANSPVPILDLREDLVAAKAGDVPAEGDFVYYPLGTHWGHRGAVVATRAIVRALGGTVMQGVEPPELDGFVRRKAGTQGDTWAERLYLEDRLIQTSWVYAPKRRELKSQKIPHTRFGERYRQPDLPDLPRVLMHHDSYARLVRPLLARHASEQVSYWSHAWNLARIELEKPDVVVDLGVERIFVTATPRFLSIESQGELEASFEASNETVLTVGEARTFAAMQKFELFDTPLLAAFDSAERDLVVRVDVRASGPGLLELLLPVGERFPRARAVHVYVDAERRVLYVRVPGRRAGAGPFRFGTEHRAGEWTVHAVEARVVPRLEAPR
ncbi:MAG: hypothetical protein GY711_18555 [bacterium]|nr:hypothetical protein [bacterium]